MGATARGRGMGVLLAALLLVACAGKEDGTPAAGPADAVPPAASAWRFAVVGDTHLAAGAQSIPVEIVAALQADQPRLVLVPGDLVEGGAGASAATLRSQLAQFRAVTAPLVQAGIAVHPVRGNHENDVPGNLAVWNEAFSGAAALPANGPAGEVNLTYAFSHANALFIGLDHYASPHRVNQAWLDAQLAANTRSHVFVYGHETAFKVRHEDGLDDDPAARDAYWRSLAAAGVRISFSGHDHFFDLARIDDGDGNTGNDLLQCVVGSGGGTLFTQSRTNGDNGGYTPVNVFHEEAHGYLLVEVSGSGSQDLGLTLTWKQRSVDAAGTVRYLAARSFSTTAGTRTAAASAYPVVDTGLANCFDTAAVIPPPLPGQPFYGQDAQHAGRQPAYRDNGDGTVSDLATGLMWVKARGDRSTWSAAVSGAAACAAGGYRDWRMPTLKELYSLIRFTGVQGTSFTSSAGYVPFLDTSVFGFAYGSGVGAERVIDCQDWSGTAYAATTMGGVATAFGVNFADGRIKGYPSGTMLNFVRYVRGNPAYGRNDFLDHGDGTVRDRAIGLMWTRDDSGEGLDWQAALAWVQQRNAESHLGHRDWRLPDAKELQSLVDPTRAPDAADPARRGPAIDPLFRCTSITNEGGVPDWPFYWSSTSFRDGTRDGIPAAYVCFGRALGWMKPAGGSSYQLLDVHGAGAQRSDPKAGSPTDYPLGTDAAGRPVYGRGPQGDVVRIKNFVRMVRTAD